jgi:DNA-binding MarR family transcriptional regulator
MSDQTQKKSDGDNAVSDLLITAYHLIRKLRTEVYGKELSWTQVSALACLAESGSLTTAELARLLTLTPQSMGTALSSLQQAGLIEQSQHPTDRRQLLFSLTDKGKATRNQGQLIKQDRFDHALAQFSPEELATLTTATELLRRLEKP